MPNNKRKKKQKTKKGRLYEPLSAFNADATDKEKAPSRCPEQKRKYNVRIQFGRNERNVYLTSCPVPV